ncbi:serine/threonine-protein kinase [Aquabacterium sp.]|uniref:serine/threonine-protein kinase n=1 Tax=Aquabacterium sp. TaxID=1872578 RepID=UPI002BF93993|nr:serine/threonine-protein kinase [Aquabacterium sp.]HSW07665.1 serine/threonine-protein kinase [Aquabacterium sp.]
MSSTPPPNPGDLRGFAPTQFDPNPTPLSADEWPVLGDDSAPVPLDLLPEPNQAEPTIGHVGRYALKRRLGEGGLGRVYTAWDPILSRNLAIKTLQLGAAGVERELLDAMILNEARAVAGLNHPHIVTVFDAGLSERGVYIAMEQLPGMDLREMLAEGWRPDAARAAKLIRRVADALTYAHSMGVIHCDIKPANIFMVDKRKPKVLDFGIARIAHRPGSPALEGLITGSPHYLAPEQLRGGPVDERCDVYALGVVLYEVLTGRKAFSGVSLTGITQAVLEGNPVPAHALVPGLPAELSQIATRAMARDPAQRFPSAREMSLAIRRWQATQSAASAATARPVAASRAEAAPAPSREPDRTARRKRRVGLIAALALLLLAASAYWLWPGAEPAHRRSGQIDAAAPVHPV